MKITNLKLDKFFLLFVIWFIFSNQAIATPFNVFDARTMAMGGVGVATGTHNAVFNNPALMTTVDEIHEWFLMLPAVAQERQDLDNLKDNLSSFQDAADRLDLVNNVANQNAVQAKLDDLDGIHYHASNNIALMIAIPSRILSGAVFLNSYEQYSAKPIIGGDNLTVPTYVSTLAHRGFRVVENGVSTARALNAEKGWASNMAIGVSAKFLLLETYNYETGLRSSEIKIDGSQGQNSSQFELDVGMFKEFGVWKLALVGKNLLPGEFDLAGTNEKLKISPQLRAGFAYQSRRAVLELNVDLLENDPVAFESETKMVAIGWEYRPKRFFAIRAGANQNLVGRKANYFSTGIGLNISGFYIDIAGYTGNEGTGMAGQLGFQF
ncbi:MAG: conjugal transfer protein TraF [Gammaproteobacteria bacterium]|nr:conjugal transfer protein TraF [Gammaproteobacteria bacterium]